MTEASTGLRIKEHFGVYGVHVDADRLLTVRKSRGPYTGLLDLPGGTPEDDESRSQTLERELTEETGGRILARGPWRSFDLHVGATSNGERIDYHHTAVWCVVGLVDVDRSIAPFEDVEELVWVHVDGWRDRDDLAAPVREVLERIEA